LALALNAFAARGQVTFNDATSWIQEGKVLANRVQTNAWRLQQTQQLDNQLRQQLASLTHPDEDALANVIEQNKALRLRLLDLEKKFAELKVTNSNQAISIADLEKELMDAEKERDRLVKKQSDLLTVLSSTNGTKGLRRELLLKDLEPITIKLVKNRLVPMMEPFYSSRRGKLKVALSGELIDGIVISRVHDGESAANAVRPGGLLDTLLSKADPKKNYFRLLVCADSISAFQIVPQAVSKRGFAYSWDTAKDEDIVQSLDQLRRQQRASIEDRGYWPTAPP
jgi:hypothetical protein